MNDTKERTISVHPGRSIEYGRCLSCLEPKSEVLVIRIRSTETRICRDCAKELTSQFRMYQVK